MGKFDFALPRPLKVELEIPGYDAKRAAQRIHAQEAHERERFKRQHGAGRVAKPAAAPTTSKPTPQPTPADDVYELQESLRAATVPSVPDLSEALELPVRKAGKKKAGRR